MRLRNFATGAGGRCFRFEAEEALAFARAMQLEFRAVSDFGLKATAEVLARGFADYFVPIASTEATLWAMARGDSVDFAASRVAVRAGEPVGVALIARRGWTSRLAGMALVPAARRQGVGRALVEQVIAEARGRGDRQFELEVIEQNEPAVKLYEATGFQRRRRLVGFAGRAGPADPENRAADLREVDGRLVAARLAAAQPADWPWQLSAETIAQLTPPHVAFEQAGAWVVLTNPAAAPVTVRALVTESGGWADGRAERLLRAVAARYPDRDFRIGALWPEEVSAVFGSVGWARQSLSQWQMGLAL